MPTPTLEETIRDLAARGEISNLSLAMNSTYTKWRAAFAPCSVFGSSFAEDEDPIKALLLAMTSAGLRKPRSGSARALAAEEARATGKIEQDTVEVTDEYLAGIQAKTNQAKANDDDIDAMM